MTAVMYFPTTLREESACPVIGITAGIFSMVVSVAVVMEQRFGPHGLRIRLQVTVGAESRLQVPV